MATTPPATAAIPQPTATKSKSALQGVLATSTSTPPSDAERLAFPLSAPGPYFVGNRGISYVDQSRNGREVPVTVWYPALAVADAEGHVHARDAAPDPSGAPYPLIVSSTKVGQIFAPYLVSHGFTWAGVDRLDTYPQMNEQLYEQPFDILFTLDQVASNPPEGLDGMSDAEHAGAIGYSFDGYNTLAMSGARLDPEYYLAQCETPDDTTSEIVLSRFSSFSCLPASGWDEFAAQVGETITSSQDGLWQPMTDQRIRAVMPLASEGWWLFGERGLAAVDRPTLILVATEDELYSENALIFEHLGTSDKALISFLGLDHMMIYNPEMVERMAHFATAFFGYHLQGRQDLAEFFSQDFVSQHEDLAWGVVEGE